MRVVASARLMPEVPATAETLLIERLPALMMVAQV